MTPGASEPGATRLDDSARDPLTLSELTLPSGPGAMGIDLVATRDGLVATWLEPVPEDADTQARDKTASKSTAGDIKSPHTTFRLQFARARNNAFGTPVTVAESDQIVKNWANYPSIIEGPNDTLFVHYEAFTRRDIFAYDSQFVRSDDGGATWTSMGTPHADGTKTEHGFVSLVRDGDRVHGFWLDGRERSLPDDFKPGDPLPEGPAPPMTLRTIAIDATAEPGVPMPKDSLVDGRVCDCCSTDAAMTPNGPVVVYRDRDADEIRDIAISRWTNNGWSEPTPVHRDSWKFPGCPVNGPSIVSRDRTLAVAWYTYAGSTPRVRVAFSNDSGVTFAAPIEVDGPRGSRAPIGRVHLAWADTGETIVSWMASARERAQVLARRVYPDGRMGAERVLVSSRAGRSAGFPRIAIHENTLYLAWRQADKPSSVRVGHVPMSALPSAAAAPTATPTVVDGAAHARLRVGEPAPAYEAFTLAGATIDLASLRGAPALINVWATWCEPCRYELPELRTVHETYTNRGVRVIGVSVDRDRSREQVKAFVDRRRVPYDVWHDPDDRAADVLGVSVLPMTVLVDRDGVVVWKHTGAVDASDPGLRSAIQATLATNSSKSTP